MHQVNILKIIIINKQCVSSTTYYESIMICPSVYTVNRSIWYSKPSFLMQLEVETSEHASTVNVMSDTVILHFTSYQLFLFFKDQRETSSENNFHIKKPIDASVAELNILQGFWNFKLHTPHINKRANSFSTSWIVNHEVVFTAQMF